MLAYRLHLDVLEAEMSFQLKQAHMIASSGKHGHPDMDVNKGNLEIADMLSSVMRAIPYMAFGGDGRSAIQQDREDASERFKKMTRDVMKTKPDAPRKTLKIVPVGQRK